jgi:hypothetical protein
VNQVRVSAGTACSSIFIWLRIKAVRVRVKVMLKVRPNSSNPRVADSMTKLLADVAQARKGSVYVFKN